MHIMLEYAPPIGPELVSWTSCPPPGPTNDSGDSDDKESYRRKLPQERPTRWRPRVQKLPKSPPRHYETSSIRMVCRAQSSFADIGESDDFLELVKRYDELMARGQSRFHLRF